MVANVSEWLEMLGLGQYASTFIDNDVDAELLIQLTDTDLKELGISSLGHRKRILCAIEKLDTAEPERSSSIVPRGEAEHRQLTVMFCDMVGSTELSQQLDPEDLQEVNRAFQDACKTPIERYEGYVARYMGDGVLAYFGFPQAHEDDAERAIHAGLDVINSIPTLSTLTLEKQDIELAVRVGIATGPVVVGDLIGEGASQESAAVGETPNIAARLQSWGQPNSLTIAPSTRELAGSGFKYEDLGAQKLKGISELLRIWNVIGHRDVESRFEARQASNLSPYVGRDVELEMLVNRWTLAKGGEGQLVLLAGEPGVGKSRAVLELHRRIENESHTQLQYQCSPHYTNSAFYPVITQLERAAGISHEDTPQSKLDKLEVVIAQGTWDVKAVIPFFSDLLTIPNDGRYAKLDFTPKHRREKTLEALVHQIIDLSNNLPVFVVFEDVHWIDPTTHELLDRLVETLRESRVYLIITFRPEYKPPWVGQAHATLLTLSRLSNRQSAEMIRKISGSEGLPEEDIAVIVEKTDGVPLFMEELTKNVIEEGTSGARAVPSSLHASLLARMDRLGEVKGLAQLGAVIGREFSYELISLVTVHDTSMLHSQLEQLVASGLVLSRGVVPDSLYTFKHALIQDTAYESLLRSKRQKHHNDIAEALESRFPEMVSTQPELLAHHYTEAGNNAEGANYWLQAGRLAAERSADPEAVGHLSKGLSALSELPEALDRNHQELTFQLALCSPLMNTEGWGSEETVQTYARARELCELLGEIEQLLPVMFGQWVNHGMYGQHRAGREVATELLHLSKQQGNTIGIMQGHRMLAINAMFLGEYPAIETHVEKSLSLYDPQRDRLLGLDWVYEPSVGGMLMREVYQWASGLLDQAFQSGTKAVAHARDLNQVSTLLYALQNECCFRILARDLRTAEAISKELLVVAEEQDFPFYIAWGRMLVGWSNAKCGRRAEGIPLLHEELQRLGGIEGQKLYRPLFLALLAELYLEGGEIKSAQLALDEARQIIEETGERMLEAEIYRLLGEVHVAHEANDNGQAKTDFEKAIKIARHQSVKPLELRATVSLARLLDGQRESDAAYRLLEPIYGSFIEGFDTPDLIEAKELLVKLR
jgi:class 3 adenylate cyclase/predicted ATPase/DNA polymerase III delta prime subunit